MLFQRRDLGGDYLGGLVFAAPESSASAGSGCLEDKPIDLGSHNLKFLCREPDLSRDLVGSDGQRSLELLIYLALAQVGIDRQDIIHFSGNPIEEAIFKERLADLNRQIIRSHSKRSPSKAATSQTPAVESSGGLPTFATPHAHRQFITWFDSVARSHSSGGDSLLNKFADEARQSLRSQLRISSGADVIKDLEDAMLRAREAKKNEPPASPFADQALYGMREFVDNLINNNCKISRFSQCERLRLMLAMIPRGSRGPFITGNLRMFVIGCLLGDNPVEILKQSNPSITSESLLAWLSIRIATDQFPTFYPTSQEFRRESDVGTPSRPRGRPRKANPKTSK